MAATDLALWIRHRIASRTPTSVIRFGDGEGNFLPYQPALKSFEAEHRYSTQQYWWGVDEDIPKGALAEEMVQGFRQAVDNADAIGIPAVNKLAEHFLVSHRDDNRVTRGFVAAARYLYDPPRLPTHCEMLFSWNAHVDLMNWGLYATMLASIEEVNFVSCYDLAPFLLENYGLRTKWSYRTSVGRLSEVASPEDDRVRPLYPNGLNAFIETAPIEPGDVYLVAVGFVGKIVCDHIKRRGGIAIDIGSVADNWAGFQFRSWQAKDIEFDIRASLIADQPLGPPPPIVRSSSPMVRTDRTRRRDIGPEWTGSPQDLNDKTGHYGLRMLGHPRCGSAYVTQAFVARGLFIRHERLGADGICNWMACVNDLAAPYGDVTARCTFEHTGAYMRHPRDAIPSIVLENGNAQSFLFRRYHIFNRYEVDLVTSPIHWSGPLPRSSIGCGWSNTQIQPSASGWRVSTPI